MPEQASPDFAVMRSRTAYRGCRSRIFFLLNRHRPDSTFLQWSAGVDAHGVVQIGNGAGGGEPMNAEAFSSPIFVKRASYIVQEIASLADAIDFLNEWPEDRRDLTYETALRACCDAYAGHIPVGAASNALSTLQSELPYWRTQPPPCSGSLRARRAAERCRRKHPHWRKATLSRLS